MQTAIEQLINTIRGLEQDGNIETVIKYLDKTEKYYIAKERNIIIRAFEDGNDLGSKGRLPSGEGYYEFITKVKNEKK